MTKRLIIAFFAILFAALPARAQFPDQSTFVATGGGTVNAQTALLPNALAYADILGVVIKYIPSVSNTGAATLNISSLGAQTTLKQTPAGLTALSANDIIANRAALVLWYGVQFELLNPATSASLTVQDQKMTGGATVTPYNIGTVSSGTLTIDFGQSPLQYVTNNGAFTLAAPSSDGSAMLLITNGSSAGAIGQSGFSLGANTGDNYLTTFGYKFTFSIWRINGISSYLTKALQ